MVRFNRAWEDESRIDASLDLIDAVPVNTPWGLMTRNELRSAIFGAKEGCPGATGPISQTVQILDETHALCTEKWLGRKAADCVVRWTFLVKGKNGWGIGYISQNATEDAT